MRSWYDDPTAWDTAQGKRLRRLLAGVFTTEVAAQLILDDAGLEHLMKTGTGNPLYMWNHILRAAHQRGQLRTLLDSITAEEANRALVDQFEDLSRPALPDVAGNPADPYGVVLVGLQQRPMVDRANLRAHVRTLIDNRYPVLIIRDSILDDELAGRQKRRSGKSFSVEFINHIVASRDIKLVLIDMNHRCTSVDHVMQRICRCLGLTAVSAHTSDTTATKYAEELVDDLAGKLTDNRSRIIVMIDGLDRDEVEKSVHDLAAYFAERVAKNQLPHIQLVLTGYHGDLGPRVGFPLIEEIDTVTDAHVRAFFETLIQELTPGQPLPQDILDECVVEAITHIDDMEALEVVIRERALTLIGNR